MPEISAFALTAPGSRARAPGTAAVQRTAGHRVPAADPGRQSAPHRRQRMPPRRGARGVSPHSPRGPLTAGGRARGKPAPSRARAEPPHAPPAPARPWGARGPRGSVWRTAQLPPLAAQGALPARADRYHDATAKNRTVPAPARGQYGGYPLAPWRGGIRCRRCGADCRPGSAVGTRWPWSRWTVAVPGALARLPGAVRAKAVIFRCKRSRGPCGGSRGGGRPYRTAGTGQRHIRSGDFSPAASGDTHLAVDTVSELTVEL